MRAAIFMVVATWFSIFAVDVMATSTFSYIPNGGIVYRTDACPTDFTEVDVGDRGLSFIGATTNIGSRNGFRICASAQEGQTFYVTCPSGTTITKVNYARYGKPSGNCGGPYVSNAPGGCNAANVTSWVTTNCLGQTTCSGTASTTTFGISDPCSGWRKTVFFEVVCTVKNSADKVSPKHFHHAQIGRMCATGTTQGTSVVRCACGAPCLTKYTLNKQFCNMVGNNKNGVTTPQESGYGFVQLRACRYTGPQFKYTIPKGAVIPMDSTYGFSTCPVEGNHSTLGTSWRTYSSATGRTMYPHQNSSYVILFTNYSSTEYGVADDNPPAQLGDSALFLMNAHNHALSASFAARLGSPTGQTGGDTSLSPILHANGLPISGSFDDAELNIPFKKARVCVSTKNENPAGLNMPVGTHVLFSRQGQCPKGGVWAMETAYDGRLIVNAVTTTGVYGSHSGLLPFTNLHNHPSFGGGIVHPFDVQSGSVSGQMAVIRAQNSFSSNAATDNAEMDGVLDQCNSEWGSNGAIDADKFLTQNAGERVVGSTLDGATPKNTTTTNLIATKTGIPTIRLVLCKVIATNAPTAMPTKLPTVSGTTAAPGAVPQKVVAISLGWEKATALIQNGPVNTTVSFGLHARGLGTNGVNFRGNGDDYIGDDTDELGFNIPSLALPPNVSQIANKGAFHGCALAGGSVYCWSTSGTHGEVGNGAFTASISPSLVSGITDAILIDASFLDLFANPNGRGFACALLSDKATLKCWGSNDRAQLGINSTTNQALPVTAILPSGVSHVKSFSLGHRHTCVISQLDQVFCWGSNLHAQHGTGAAPDDLPHITWFSSVVRDGNGFIPTAKTVKCGFENTCIITLDANLKCWGYNYQGNLGGNFNIPPYQHFPVDVLGISDVVDLSVSYTTCAVDASGFLYCFGYNGGGNLGLGHNDYDYPAWIAQKVPGVSDAIGVGTGTFQTCYINVENRLKCWGQNYQTDVNFMYESPLPLYSVPTDFVNIGTSTIAPTNAPTMPTSSPTRNPTATITNSPTLFPTWAPTNVNPTAAPTAGSGPCGINSNFNFVTWLNSVVTRSPLLYPVTDADLQYILARAAANNCKVRVAGSGHSEDGVVHQKNETNVVVINLSSYRSPAPWTGTIDATVPSVKISAGASFLDLISVIRPAGYVMVTQTAGFFFSIGGVMMNPSVHGGALNANRLNTLVLSLRVMLANGTIAEITNIDEVIAWRGSLGLLGIALGLEVKIKADVGIKLDVIEKVFNGLSSDKVWNQANFNAMHNDMLTNYGSAEYFLNVYDNTLQIEAIDYDGAPGFDFASTKPYYDALKTKFSGNNDLARTGGQVSDSNQIFSTILSTNNLKLLNTLVMLIGFGQTKEGWEANMAGPRDAYFVAGDGLVKFDQLYIYVKCPGDCVNDNTTWRLVDATRTYLQTHINKVPLQDWYPSLPLEWRFVDIVAGTQLLEHLTTGRWLALELVNAKDSSKELNHAKYFRELEILWKGLAGEGNYQIHHGKSWGLEFIPGITEPIPFQNDTMINNVYTTTVKNAFIAKMDQYDPTGLFRAGAALRMLGLSDIKFDPRKSEGGECSTNTECFPRVDLGETTGCCCTDALLCTLPQWDVNQCTEQRGGKGQRCRVQCECKAGLACTFVLYTFDYRCT